LAALAQADSGGALAVITGIEGASYRPLGAMMALGADGRRVGSLSSGCIEADISRHGAAMRANDRPRKLRYGLGSPWRDITLPCGGGLDILLLPAPDRTLLREALARHGARQALVLKIHAESGALALSGQGSTGWDEAWFSVRIEPEIFFYVFGKGPEAATFAALAQAAGFSCLVLSPDDDTLVSARDAGAAVRHLVSAGLPADLAPDGRSAVVLFFHDHEWEPPILAQALTSPAFYSGAQGSRAARQARDSALLAAGVDKGQLARIRGPIGLVPGARDARMLAVSVLAEVLAQAQQEDGFPVGRKATRT
ncbi:MAG TPA: XdhC family protein, partial [Aliiroseovarius sp.]|nr:XdhC family protein [Aliiroseovarius sp.]